jgi:bacterioferritin (cytochrome b1)
MRWTCTIAQKGLIAALNADILYEVEMADDCIRRADLEPQQYRGPIRNRTVQCAAASLRNASALAAEVLSLGGIPPGTTLQWRSGRCAAESIEGYILHARSALKHYQHRLAMADRLGPAQLREIFQEIVLSKQRHLAHAGLVAAEGLRPRQLS